MARVVRIPVSLTLAAALLCACGGGEEAAAPPDPSSSAPEPSAAPSPPGAPSEPPAPSAGVPDDVPGSSAPALARCTVEELEARLEPGDPGAGQRSASIVLTSTAGGPCLVQGYGGGRLVAADGTALPTDLQRTGDGGQPVVLDPGQSVSSLLHWGAVPGEGDAQSGDCQPTPATLEVTPPDETRQLEVEWTFGPVCRQGHIEQEAYGKVTG